jgi:hypothetical protein
MTRTWKPCFCDRSIVCFTGNPFDTFGARPSLDLNLREISPGGFLTVNFAAKGKTMKTLQFLMAACRPGFEGTPAVDVVTQDWFSPIPGSAQDKFARANSIRARLAIGQAKAFPFARSRFQEGSRCNFYDFVPVCDRSSGIVTRASRRGLVTVLNRFALKTLTDGPSMLYYAFYTSVLCATEYLGQETVWIVESNFIQ